MKGGHPILNALYEDRNGWSKNMNNAPKDGSKLWIFEDMVVDIDVVEAYYSVDRGAWIDTWNNEPLIRPVAWYTRP